MTRIGEHDDLGTLVQVAANHLGVSRLMVEKDYWVTETLRELVRGHSGQFVFKGGTSLFKCFDIARRFSEDIDVLLNDTFVTGGERERGMKAMQATVVGALPFTARTATSKRGVYRPVYLQWPRPAWDAGGTLTGVAPEILLEMGTRGATAPVLVRPVLSMLVQALIDIDPEAARDFLPEHDRTPFEVDALHPGRTLVEKLLLLLGRAEALAEHRIAAMPARQGRHIFDVIELLNHDLVREFLSNRDEFLSAVQHAQEVSAEYWGDGTCRPDGGFAVSLLLTGGPAVDDAFANALNTDLPGMLMGDQTVPALEAFRNLLIELAEYL